MTLGFAGRPPGRASIICLRLAINQTRLSPFLDESEKDPERHGRLAAARMIEEDPWRRSAPVLQQTYEPALREVRGDHRFGQMANAASVEDVEQQKISIVDDERPVDGDLDVLIALGVAPRLYRAIPGRRKNL